MSKNNLEKKIKNITWNHLKNWAGGKILRRGENYFKSGRVSNLRITPEGILARVSGSKDYVTHVIVKGPGTSMKINSECTCPYGYNCKHAVATVLAYSQAIKDKIEVSVATLTDPDIIRIEDEVDEEVGDEYEGADNSDEELSEFIDKQSKAFLKELTLKLAEKYPEVKSELLDKARLGGGETKKMVKAIRKEIARITSEPAWSSHWSDEGNLADFSRVQSAMSNLFDLGQYDAVIEITKELISEGTAYVGSCDDDGDSAMQISECMEIGFQAVKKCKWSDFEKIMFALETLLKDEYELFNGAGIALDSIRDKSAWSRVADELSKKLKELPSSKSENGEFSRNYKRNELSNFIISALEYSDRAKEILPLCEREAPITDSYERYVDRLIKLKKYETARKVAEEGIKRLNLRYPGIVKSLRERIAKLAEKSGDFQSILLLKQEEFWEYSSLDSYDKLLKSASRTKNKSEVRLWALEYLKTGKPKTIAGFEKNIKPKKRSFERFPDYKVLIDIAEKEKDPDRVLFWYRKAGDDKSSYFHGHAQVARAIGEEYPDIALEIWRNLAEKQIALTNPSAYEEAVSILANVRNIYLKTKREKGWTNYLDKLKETNKRKTRFLQSLRSLTDEKLI